MRIISQVGHATFANQKDSLKHSLNLAFKLPSDKGRTNGFLETFAKSSLQVTLRQGQNQWIPGNCLETFAKKAFKLPSDMGNTNEFFEAFAKLSLQVTLRQRQNQWIP